MKILYVSDFWTPLTEIVYNGFDEMNGMPGFQLTLKKLIDDGHKIDILFYDFNDINQKKKYNIKSCWFNKINIVNHLFFKRKTGIKKLFSYINIWSEIKQEVSSALEKEKYDFVYGQGPISVCITRIVKKRGIPFGQRLYGSSYWDRIVKKGYVYASLSMYPEYLSLKKRKSFILATNDGSRLDKAYEYVNKNKIKAPFYFWINGYPTEENKEIFFDEKKVKTPYLLYIARVVHSKRQHLALEIVRKLKEQNILVNLYFGGQKDDLDYYKSLCDLAERYCISEQVVFWGSIRKDEIKYYSERALACLSLYETTNFGNVIIEYLSSGGVVISCNDGSLNSVIRNGENGFLVDNMEQASEIVRTLINDVELSKGVKGKAKKSASKYFKTWEKRVQDEVDLIKKYVGKGVYY